MLTYRKTKRMVVKSHYAPIVCNGKRYFDERDFCTSKLKSHAGVVVEFFFFYFSLVHPLRIAVLCTLGRSTVRAENVLSRKYLAKP